MSLQKNIIICMCIMALIGTVGNYLLKVHERGIVETEEHMVLRIRQLQDECNRKLAEQKEKFVESWRKKVKEWQLAKGGQNDSSSKQFQDQINDLQSERDSLRLQLNNVRKDHDFLKNQLDEVRKALKEAND